MIRDLNTAFDVRIAQTSQEVSQAQELRHRCFYDGAQGADSDAFDPNCTHILVHERKSGKLVSTVRAAHFETMDKVVNSYSAQSYNLSNLKTFDGSALELSRFCVDPAYRDPNIVPMCLAKVTQMVDEHDVGILFGCSSFKGIDYHRYDDAFALLREQHLAPHQWRPEPKASKVYPFTVDNPCKVADKRIAQKTLPPLLRSYLALGGWVSDHAVIDSDLNTLHVFTGVEVDRIPEQRKQLLRRLVA